MDELTGRVAIYCALGRDVRTFRRTLGAYGSALEALAHPGLIARARSALEPSVVASAEAVLASAEAVGLRWTWPGRADYPARLAPAGAQLLSVLGDLPAAGPALAVVGSRDADHYGVELSACLGAAAASVGATLVSGGAAGVDHAAHEAALAAGGRTVVVLGTGLAAGLRRDPWLPECVASGRGAVVSELLPDAAGAQWTFPDRNRLIAAWGDAIVVVQAGRKSGTLYTARHGREYGRPVFAIAGDVGMPLTEGVHDLLAEGGARLLRSPLDLEEALGVRGLRSARWPSGRRRTAPASGAAQVLPDGVLGQVVALLQTEGAATAAALEARLGERLDGVLLDGELAGLVARDAQGRYTASSGG